jgi:intein/homing endonuclease
MYVPQELECVGELECLMQSREHLLCGNQGVVQDTALAGYLLTLEDCKLTKILFFKCLMFVLCELDANAHLEAHFDLSEVSEGPYTGRALLSCLLGEKISIEGLVEAGTIVAVLNKATWKKKVLRKVVELYGKKEASNFLFLLSRIGSEFLRRRGFSVGVSSLEPWKKIDEAIVVPERVKEFMAQTQTKDPWLLLRLGNLYKSLKALKTKEIFSDDNPMLLLGSEKSGAKGSLLNLIQIRSSLGQQYYKGSLIRHFRADHRVLSSDKKGALSKDEALLQRGFIDSNFLKGLTPREVMLHAMTSRLSLLDTALKTSETGYASRRLGKSLEDCIIQYDNTLRNNDRVLFFEIDHFKDKDMVAGHAIGVIAAQSIGQRIMQLTLNSVDWYTDLIIRWHAYNEAPKYGSVGLLIDALMEHNKPLYPDPDEPSTVYLEIPKGHAEALTVDEDGAVHWKPLLAVTRHPPKNKDGSNMLLKITTRSGRTVTCTKAKSFLVVEKGQVQEISGEDLRVGHQLPVTYTLPPTDTYHLDLSVYLSKKMTLFTSSCVAAHKSMVSGQNSWFPPHQSTLPYSRSDSCRVALTKFKHLLKAGFVYPKVGHHSAAGIPEHIELTRAFGFFVGAYLAEGCLTDHQVHISNNDPAYRKAAAEWPSSIGINHHETLPKDMHKNGGISISIMFHSSLLVRILRRVCGSGAFEKKVPVCAFSAPETFVCGLLDAYISGDGSVSKNGAISAGSRSEKLIDNMMLLMHRIGVPSTRMAFAVKEKTFFALYVRLLHAQQFTRMVTLTDKGKMKRLLEAKPKNGFRKRTIQYYNDVMMDAVKKIEEVPSSHPFVYDLTVADTKNMVEGSGVGLRDTFHTAGTACLEVSDGVPRMEALINVWGKKLQQNAILEINGVKAWRGHQMIRQYDTVYTKDILFQNIKVVRIKNPPPSCCTYGVKMYLDELVCKKARICSWDLEVSIRASLLYPELVPVARDTCVTCFLQKPLEGKEAKLYLLQTILPQLRKLCLRGKELKLKASWSMNKLHLKGISLREGFSCFFEDWQSIASTNTLEVYSVLGIEAARIVLLRELNKVFNKGVRDVFLLTLCEWMCWNGFLCPVTRTGILQSNDNAWKNMAFEQCLKTACKNATSKATHGFEGTSERIVVNDFVKQGSGCCSVLEVIGQEVLRQKVVEAEEGQDDEADIYGFGGGAPAFQQNLGNGLAFSNSLQSLWSG